MKYWVAYQEGAKWPGYTADDPRLTAIEVSGEPLVPGVFAIRRESRGRYWLDHVPSGHRVPGSPMSRRAALLLVRLLLAERPAEWWWQASALEDRDEIHRVGGAAAKRFRRLRNGR